MENQTDLKELLTALCKAQAEYPDIPKTRTGREGNREFKYADLNDIHKAIKPINVKHGLSISHKTTDTHIITSLYHNSGQCLLTSLPLKLTETPKHNGATLTYLKRYNIQSLLDISTEEDLDSIDTQAKPPEKPAAPASRPPNIGKVTEPQLKRMFAICKEKSWTHEQVKLCIKAVYNLDSTTHLNQDQYNELISVIERESYVQAMKGMME